MGRPLGAGLGAEKSDTQSRVVSLRSCVVAAVKFPTGNEHIVDSEK
jgi:hypothetical protein